MSLKKRFGNIAAVFLMVLSTIAPIGNAFPHVAYAADGDPADAPQRSKTLTDNGDGTYTLTLSVTGKSSQTDNSEKANVVVVYDTSASMKYPEPSTQYGRYGYNYGNGYTLNTNNYVDLYSCRSTDRNGYGQNCTRIGANDNHNEVFYAYNYYGETYYLPYSGSRYDNKNATKTRADVAESALKSLGNKLLDYNGKNGAPNDMVEIAFIDFATTINASTTHTNAATNAPTTSKTTFENWVTAAKPKDGVNAGTNWEAALNAASGVDFGDNDTTYVIFVSDGDPTFRSTKHCTGRNCSDNDDNDDAPNGIHGSGHDDPNGWNLSDAQTIAANIVSAGKKLYTVGVFGDASKMQALNSQAIYKDATDQTALEAAFDDIAKAITNSLSLTGLSFNDGITAMTSVAIDGTTGGFTYTKNGSAWADAPAAKFKDGAVTWNLGDALLGEGETATVSFIVYPSQEAVDLVADLNNGILDYEDDLTPAQRAQVIKNGDNYTLKTNTDYPTLTYQTVTTTTVNGVPTTSTSDPKTVKITQPDPVDLYTEEVAMQKLWEDSLDPSQRKDEVEDIYLQFYIDGVEYKELPNYTDDGIKISKQDGNVWGAGTIFIAPGLMVSEGHAAYNENSRYGTVTLNGKKYSILNPGHEYKFGEKDINSHFELTNYIYHPMLVDGKLMNVTFTMSGNTITGVESAKEMSTISATNTIKGGINVEKKLVDEDGNPITDSSETFDVKIDLKNPDKNNTAYSYDYRIYYGKNNPEYDNCADKNDCRSGHIYGSGLIEEQLYVGDVIRVVNVNNGTLFYVSEDDIPFGYELQSIDYQISQGSSSNPSDFTDSTTIGGKEYYAVIGNAAAFATLTNKYTSGNLKLSKTVNGNPSVAKGFDFKVVFKDNKGAELTGTYNYTLGNKKGTITSGSTIKLSAGQEAEFLNLPAGATYEITETSLPGYTTTVNGVAGNVARGTISNTTEASAAFVNTYNLEKVSTSFVADKQFNDWTANDKFVFELRDQAGNYITEATVDQGHKSATFNVEYSAPGEYIYTISEKALEDNARNQHINTTTAPNTLTVTVKVYDDGEGHLKIDGEPTFEGNKSTIVNTYESTGSITIGAGKILTGRDWADGDAFTFDLYDLNGDTEKKIGTVRLENGEVVNFDTAISYTTEDRDKTFYYVIREDESKSGHSAGLTNQNPNGVAITVTLSDDHQGNLTATINGTEGNTFTGTIENKYETKPTTATLDVQKTIEDLTNSKRDGEFEFQLIDKNGNVLQTKKITTNNLTGSVAFNAISYDKAGTYTYTIKEVKGSTKGFTYDETVHTVVVTVVDNIDTAQLSATVTVDGKNTSTASFNNTYAAKSVTEELFGVSKKVTGLAAGAPTKNFVFDLTGDTADSVTINGEGSESFKPLTYTAVGEYHYTISERNTGESGYTYDTTVYTATVNVDDVNGELKPTVTIKKGGSVVDKIEFTNTYAATGSAKISVKKEFAGAARDWSNDSFTFTLEETDSVLGEATASANTNWMATFDDIEYTEAGTYTYMIKESESNLAGVSASDPVKVIVIVTDMGDGTLKAEVQDPSSYVITNIYETKATSATLHVEKEIEDQSNSDVDGTFTFILKDSEGKEIETKDVTTTDGEGGVDFSTISYDKAGEYRYTITEKADSQAGFTYDTKEYEVVVNVTDDPSKAQLSAEVKINGVVTDEAKFTNIYKATPVDVQLHVNKEIEDQSNSKVDGTFEFKLSDSDNEEVEIIRVSTKDLVGGADFSKINFTETGTYNYTIEEVKGTTAGFSYDTTKHNVVITVSDKESKLVAEVKIDGEETKSITITNEYKAEPVTIIPGAYKVLTGMNEGVEPADFSFTLSGDNIDDETVTRNGEGSVEFSPITIEKVGTYEYTVTEINDGAPGYTYDDSIFSIIVEVTDAVGKLEAKISYKKNGERAYGVIFENTYSTEEITIVPEATKILLGRNQEKGEFTFKVFLDGELVATGYNDENGNVIFDNEISFGEVGTYKLAIKEIAGNDPEIEYDTTEYEYTLKVSDTGLGTLMVEYEGGAEDAIFVNKFIGGKGEEVPSNPRTYDDIATSIAILSTSIIGLIAAVIFGKRQAKED